MTCKKNEERVGIPFKINKVIPTNPRGIEIKRLGDVAEWRCRVFRPPFEEGGSENKGRGTSLV